MKVKFTKYTAVATWRWKQGAEDDVCGICQMAFESTCPNDACKYPGEGCPVTAGECTHTFHKHCLDGWLQNKSECPMCRQRFRTSQESKNITTEQAWVRERGTMPKNLASEFELAQVLFEAIWQPAKFPGRTGEPIKMDKAALEALEYIQKKCWDGDLSPKDLPTWSDLQMEPANNS